MLPLAAALFLPFACWEGTPGLCLDMEYWRIENQSHEPIVITPMYADGDRLLPLVVHGFQRGRFSIPANDGIELGLETGDHRLAAVVVVYPGDDVRLITRQDLDELRNTLSIVVAPRSRYQPAPAEARDAASISALVAPRLRDLVLGVALPPLPFAVAAALVARGRSREDRLNAGRKLPP